jgi:hypothetical protein
MRNAVGLVHRLALLTPSLSTLAPLGSTAATAAFTRRSYASAAALVMSEFGVPEHVLKLATVDIPLPESLRDNEVLINILAVSFYFFPENISYFSFFF